MAWETFSGFDSSNISCLKYDNHSQILEVIFNSGGVYHYFNVPAQVWEDFKRADSKGKYLHEHIKGCYRYSKV